MLFELAGKKVWVQGHRGMVGSAIVRRLKREACEIITAGREVADLRRQSEVESFLNRVQPDAIVMAAAKVGGILANDNFPADFLYDNLMIEANVFEAARLNGVGKVIFLGSSCIYPKFAPQPILEEYLLDGPLEPTNAAYAIAKIAGVKLARAFRKQYGSDFISAMPTNLYGPGDNFDLHTSHVIPALIRKAHEAKLGSKDHIVVWGTGAPRREFLHADDCADAIVFLLKSYSGDEHVNVGWGEDVSIRELTKLVCQTVGFSGEVVYDLSKPDGTPRKLMSSSRLNAMGWKPTVDLESGLRDTYRWFLEAGLGDLAGAGRAAQ